MIWAAIVLSWFVCAGLGFLAAALCAAAGRTDDDVIIAELLDDIDMRDARIRDLQHKATR